MTRGEAYRQRVLYPAAEKEYRAALRFAPNDVDINLALSEVIYRERRYEESAQILRQASVARPDDPVIYARLAQAYAKLGRQAETFEFAQKAESVSNGRSSVEMAVGEAFSPWVIVKPPCSVFPVRSTMKMETASPPRLAIARLFVRQGKADDAREQIGRLSLRPG